MRRIIKDKKIELMSFSTTRNAASVLPPPSDMALFFF